jgi:hypothetical protein
MLALIDNARNGLVRDPGKAGDIIERNGFHGTHLATDFASVYPITPATVMQVNEMPAKPSKRVRARWGKEIATSQTGPS